jgi:hypothetical protein
MIAAEELLRAFGVYIEEMARCEREHCDWALLHLAVVIPDICAALEKPSTPVGDRYIEWCAENFPPTGKLSPGDRFQMRNALLHQGTSIPDNTKTTVPAKRSRYVSFSFMSAGAEGSLHQLVSYDATRGGDNIAIDVRELTHATSLALRDWCSRVAVDPVRSSVVKSNLHQLVRLQPKELHVPDSEHPAGFVNVIRNTTSST